MKSLRYLFFVASVGFILTSCNSSKQEKPKQEPIKYPQTMKVDTVDTYFGVKIQDPYRWLENDTTTETAQWVEAQNKVTQDYLSKIPYREDFKKRLENIMNYERFSSPMHKGGKYFYFKNDGLQNQSVLYIQNSLEENAEVFLDPNKLSTDGTVALGTLEVTKDGKYAAYSINRAGSDWQEIFVMDVATKKKLSDSLGYVKFSGISWKGSEGFYYSRYNAPKKGSMLSGQNEFMKVYYHKVGTPQAQDKLIFEDKTRPLVSFGAEVSEDEQYLIIYANNGAASGNELYYQSLKNGGAVKKIFSGFDFNYGVVDNKGDKFLIMTDKSAPRYQLVEVDINNPDESKWTKIIPEQKEVMRGISLQAGKMFVTYMKDAATYLYQYSRDGKQEKEIKAPTLGNISGMVGEREDNIVFYSFSSFNYPNTILKYDIAKGESTVFKKPTLSFNPDDYETKQVFYKSKDGTQVPMFIVHKKGIKLDGNNPTYLYAYGGFNISLNPNFSTTRIILLENGGIFALANLRGGGEYGEDWHKAGMLLNKQNVFDDFIAGAEYLIANKYTKTEKLAIAGGSNGGLLVGACMAQRPDLYKVAFPAVGVLDMLRFHKFTIGHAWVPEYGSSDNEEQFKYLLKYSPLHNLKDSTAYPATMITTADHDDRVVPAHSFKFAATLQAKHKGENPVLIRIDSKAGHGAGKPTSKIIDEWADIWAFFFHNMGITPKKAS